MPESKQALGGRNPGSRTGFDVLSHRVSQLEEAHRDFSPFVREQLTGIKSELSTLNELTRQHQNLRNEYQAADHKIWEAVDTLRERDIQTMDAANKAQTEAVTVSARVDSLQRPMWLMVAALIGQAVYVLYRFGI